MAGRVSHEISREVRHAATLALVGWYLMIPPSTTVNGKPRLDLRAPFAQWSGGGKSFTSRHDCEVARAAVRKIVEKRQDHPTSVFYDSLGKQVVVTIDPFVLAKGDAIECVASDDPSLRGN
jgi:hypothetical protein